MPHEAARILGIHPGHVQRLYHRGLLVSRKLPGMTRRFLRSDVERLARESIEPATATA